MRRAPIILALSGSVVFACAISVVHQEPAKKAEDQFKNIQSFKGAAASEIVPAMQFMSASLGVDCDFCHTQKGFDSDEKKEKGAARKMIAMTREINASNFGGEKQVTCVTCHGGHTKPMNIPNVGGASRRIKRDASATVEQVFAKYRDAIGGDSALASVKTLHLSGTTTQGTQAAEKIDAYQEAPGKFLLDMHTARGEQKFGYNGTDTWASMSLGARKMDETHSQLIQRMGRFFRDAASMPMLTQSAAGTADVDGTTFTAVRGTSNNESVVLYLDRQSGLLARVAYFTTTILGDLPDVFDYSDYRKVAGVMIPFKVTHHAASGSTVVQFSTAEPNAKVTDAQFDMPK
jgi:hypothetical protein